MTAAISCRTAIKPLYSAYYGISGHFSRPTLLYQSKANVLGRSIYLRIWCFYSRLLRIFTHLHSWPFLSVWFWFSVQLRPWTNIFMVSNLQVYVCQCSLCQSPPMRVKLKISLVLSSSVLMVVGSVGHRKVLQHSCPLQSARAWRSTIPALEVAEYSHAL